MAELNSTPEKAGKKSRPTRAALRVDLTAMVDLAFLLITFFILTTTLAKPKAMAITMPVGDKPGAVTEKRTMTICLGKNNQAMYYLGLAEKPIVSATITNYGRNGIRKAINDLGNRVIGSTGKNLIVIIKPAPSSIYENLVNTIDELHIADVQQYAIADIAPKDISLLKEKRAY